MSESKSINLLITTRDYYSLTLPNLSFQEVDRDSLLAFSEIVKRVNTTTVSTSQTRNISAILGKKKQDSPTDESNPLEFFKEMFLRGGSSEDKKKYRGFWDSWDYKLYLKHISLKSGGEVNELRNDMALRDSQLEAKDICYDIYVAPCFPTKFKDTNLGIRHQYLKTIFGELLNCNSIVLAHDLDLFLINDERFLSPQDCIDAGNVLSSEIISFSKVYGFQHVDDPGTLYSDIIKKLDCLTVKSCKDIIDRLTNEQNNQDAYKKIDQFPFINDSEPKENLMNLIKSIKLV